MKYFLATNENVMLNENERIPSFGYELTLWGGCLSYRATAVAYMERENIKQVTHKNGKNYFLNELKDAMLTH